MCRDRWTKDGPAFSYKYGSVNNLPLRIIFLFMPMHWWEKLGAEYYVWNMASFVLSLFKEEL